MTTSEATSNWPTIRDVDRVRLAPDFLQLGTLDQQRGTTLVAEYDGQPGVDRFTEARLAAQAWIVHITLADDQAPKAPRATMLPMSEMMA